MAFSICSIDASTAASRAAGIDRPAGLKVGGRGLEGGDRRLEVVDGRGVGPGGLQVGRHDRRGEIVGPRLEVVGQQAVLEALCHAHHELRVAGNAGPVDLAGPHVIGVIGAVLVITRRPRT